VAKELRQDDVELGKAGRSGRLDLGGYGLLVALFDTVLEAVPPPIGLLEPKQPTELRERVRVVVHTEVGHSLPRLSRSGPDEQGSRLPASEVAAHGLRGLECQQPLRKRPARRRVRVSHRLPDGASAHVRLHGESVSGDMPGVRNALRPVCTAAHAVRVHHCDLADRRIGMGGRQSCERLLGPFAAAEQA